MPLRQLVAVIAASLSIAGFAAPAGAVSSDFERAVLFELNQARENPRAFADELRRYRDAFDGDVVHADGDPVGMRTIEGSAAVDEAIAFLERQAPLPALSEGDVLALAARDYADEQGPRGALGHISASGRSPGDRVRARGGDIYVGETIAYGQPDPVAVVRQLIVDDGEPRRGHRALVFSAMYHFAGVGCGRHAAYGEMCVVDYAGTPDGGPVLPKAAALAAR